MRKNKPYPLRLEQDFEEQVTAVSRETGLSKVDILRMSMGVGFRSIDWSRMNVKNPPLKEGGEARPLVYPGPLPAEARLNDAASSAPRAGLETPTARTATDKVAKALQGAGPKQPGRPKARSKARPDSTSAPV